MKTPHTSRRRLAVGAIAAGLLLAACGGDDDANSATPVVVAADGTGSAQRLHDLLLNNGLDFPVVREGADLPAGGSITVAPLHRGCTLPNAKVAIVAESDLTGRRRAHRTVRKQKRESASTFEDLKAGNYVVHHQHGVGKYEGMVKRAIGGVDARTTA